MPVSVRKCLVVLTWYISNTQFLVQCLRAAITIEFPVFYVLYSKPCAGQQQCLFAARVMVCYICIQLSYYHITLIFCILQIFCPLFPIQIAPFCPLFPIHVAPFCPLFPIQITPFCPLFPISRRQRYCFFWGIYANVFGQ